jgi:hypothetical protein
MMGKCIHFWAGGMCGKCGKKAETVDEAIIRARLSDSDDEEYGFSALTRPIPPMPPVKPPKPEKTREYVCEVCRRISMPYPDSHDCAEYLQRTIVHAQKYIDKNALDINYLQLSSILRGRSVLYFNGEQKEFNLPPIEAPPDQK